MKTKHVLIFVAIVWSWIGVSSPGAFAAIANEQKPEPCTAFKDFATAYNFIKNAKVLEIPEKKTIDIAKKIAAGCTGSAGRFIMVAEVLSKAGVQAGDSVALGIEFATKTNEQTEVFTSLFKKAFVAEGFDLTAQVSIRLAKRIALKPDVAPKILLSDFDKLADFCIKEKGLPLPKPECANLIERLLTESGPSQGSAADAFLTAYRFTSGSDPGANFTAHDAVGVSEQLVKTSADTVEDFIESYKFGVSTNGLSLPRAQALALAQELAALTVAKSVVEVEAKPALQPKVTPPQALKDSKEKTKP